MENNDFESLNELEETEVFSEDESKMQDNDLTNQEQLSLMTFNLMIQKMKMRKLKRLKLYQMKLEE